MATNGTLTIDTWLLAWDGAGSVQIGPWPDRNGWSRHYPYTTGCCFSERLTTDLMTKIAMMFMDFHTLIVRDRVDPMTLHREFLKIDEYRRRIAPDVDGADSAR